MILSDILSTLCGTSRGPALASLCYSNGRRLPVGCICTPAPPLVLMSKRLIPEAENNLLDVGTFRFDSSHISKPISATLDKDN